jgi:hypothetical protein
MVAHKSLSVHGQRAKGGGLWTVSVVDAGAYVSMSGFLPQTL